MLGKYAKQIISLGAAASLLTGCEEKPTNTYKPYRIPLENTITVESPDWEAISPTAKPANYSLEDNETVDETPSEIEPQQEQPEKHYKFESAAEKPRFGDEVLMSSYAREIFENLKPIRKLNGYYIYRTDTIENFDGNYEDTVYVVRANPDSGVVMQRLVLKDIPENEISGRILRSTIELDAITKYYSDPASWVEKEEKGDVNRASAKALRQ